jgi:hypothetical protein
MKSVFILVFAGVFSFVCATPVVHLDPSETTGTYIANHQVIIKNGLILNPGSLSTAELDKVLFGNAPIYINGQLIRKRGAASIENGVKGK